MIKDYLKWTPVKTHIHNYTERIINYKERDIWICNIGDNIGFEEDGKGSGLVRPVLIIKKYGRNTCVVIPLSTTSKQGLFYHHFDGHTGKTSVALLSQIRTIDSLRLRRKIGYATKEDFITLKLKLRELLCL